MRKDSESFKNKIKREKVLSYLLVFTLAIGLVMIGIKNKIKREKVLSYLLVFTLAIGLVMIGIYVF